MIVLDSLTLPSKGDCLRGMLMTNVFHHLRKHRQMLHGVARRVRSPESCLIVQPRVVPLYQLVYTLQLEPFEPDAET